ncbi:MAG: hypothetical protein AB8C84_07340 [Oligoflexales bacterium]
MKVFILIFSCLYLSGSVALSANGDSPQSEVKCQYFSDDQLFSSASSLGSYDSIERGSKSSEIAFSCETDSPISSVDSYIYAVDSEELSDNEQYANHGVEESQNKHSAFVIQYCAECYETLHENQYVTLSCEHVYCEECMKNLSSAFEKKIPQCFEKSCFTEFFEDKIFVHIPDDKKMEKKKKKSLRKFFQKMFQCFS